HGADAGVFMRPRQPGADALDHGPVDGVAPVRPVDGDPERRAARLVENLRPSAHAPSAHGLPPSAACGSISITIWPAATWPPSATWIAVTVPARVDMWTCSIFIASSVTSGRPGATVSPASTDSAT